MAFECVTPQEPLREINIQDHKDRGIYDMGQKINELEAEAKAKGGNKGKVGWEY